MCPLLISSFLYPLSSSSTYSRTTIQSHGYMWYIHRIARFSDQLFVLSFSTRPLLLPESYLRITTGNESLPPPMMTSFWLILVKSR